MTMPVAATAAPKAAPAPKAGPAPKPANAPKANPSSNRQGGQQKQSKPRVQAHRKAPPDTPYQNVILAEFVAAIILVAATPLAQKNKAGLSPYVASDLMQLVAITVLYLILAFTSSAGQQPARFAAWFGALILLAVGLGEAARLAKIFELFGLTASSTAEQAIGDVTGQGTGGTSG